MNEKIIEANQEQRTYLEILGFFGWSVVLLMGLMVAILLYSSLPVLSEFGLSFFTSVAWDPIENHYGALPFIYGTLVTSLVAIMLATPPSVATALLVTQICPRRIKPFIVLPVQLLSAIPSIVYGLWALFTLAPFLRETFAPFVIGHLSWIPFFAGPAFGIGYFTAAVVLAIMITPLITSISMEVFQTVPVSQKEAALALGSTRLEMIWISVIRPSVMGVFGGVMLGLGRAIGETMAVAMVIGNSISITVSLFATGSTMASVIANSYSEATHPLHLGALSLIALSLFGVTLLVNAFARVIVRRVEKRIAGGLS